MATTYKVLGQKISTGTITTYDTLYGPVGVGTAAIVSTVVVCNQAATAATYRLAVCATTTPATKEFIVYGGTVPANDTITLTLGMTVDATAKLLMCSASASTVSFSAFGCEIA
jgi:hypothetical protein